jgi:hypothetical protein
LAGPGSASAQPTVRVGQIASERDCRIYLICWGPWLIIECRNNFAQLRDRLQSALAESGRFSAAGRRNAEYVLTGTVTEMGLVAASASGRDYSLNSTRAVATLDLTMREADSGRIIYAGTVTGSVDVSLDLVTDGTTISDAASARAIYASLQRETSLAASRAIAFRMDPLRVTAVAPRQVRLNYGAPLLETGANVQVADSAGFPVQYRVTAVMPDGAVAEAAVASTVAVGALASLVDRGGAPGGMNRFPRSEIPR